MASTAIVEYSLDLDLPDEVFENPIIKAMSDATDDIMTWPNVSAHSPSEMRWLLILSRTGSLLI